MAELAPAQAPQLPGSQRPGMGLPGSAEFDQDLYGQGDRFAGYEQSIGVAGDEELEDEREKALSRYARLHCLGLSRLGTFDADRCLVPYAVESNIRLLATSWPSSQQRKKGAR